MLLIAASALVIFTLGAMHCWLTFRGDALHPRDEALTRRMAEVSPRITRDTTMWGAWVSFNASHSFGAMSFGLMFGYLALAQPLVLRTSPFLVVVGAAMLGGYVFLGLRYWFSVPRRGVLIAAALYAGGVLSSW